MIKGDFNEPLFVQTDILGAGDTSTSATLEGPWIIGDDVLREFHFPQHTRSTDGAPAMA